MTILPDLALNLSLALLQFAHLLAQSDQAVRLIRIARRGVSALDGRAARSITTANAAFVVFIRTSNDASAIFTVIITTANTTLIVHQATKRSALAIQASRGLRFIPANAHVTLIVASAAIGNHLAIQTARRVRLTGRHAHIALIVASATVGKTLAIVARVVTIANATLVVLSRTKWTSSTIQAISRFR
jgi:lysylphosphatidylglycerol synthetase-like protein (DUF2156 family)